MKYNYIINSKKVLITINIIKIIKFQVSKIGKLVGKMKSLLKTKII